MKVLITGGAGFIGTNYVYTHLEARPQDELVVLDALTYSGNRSNLKAAEAAGVKFVQGRIENRKLVYELFASEQFDQVIHFAAETHVDRSIEDPSIFIQTNVVGTQTLLDAAVDHKIKKFVHVSTDEVYGDLGFGSTNQFMEDSPIRPSSPYSASKAGADLLCLSYLRTFDLPVVVTRCSNNYGPFQSTENFIPLFITRAMRNEKLPLYAKGENIRDWLFVKDHCQAILMVLENGRVGEVYNVGADNEQRNIDVAQSILKLLGKPDSLIESVADRAGHDERYSMGYDKLKQELGWTPSTSFEEGLQETINWYTLSTYERSYSSWRDGITARAADKSHQQAPIADL